jgi:thiol-disulfide isomerase/thioredoxin
MSGRRSLLGLAAAGLVAALAGVAVSRWSSRGGAQSAAAAQALFSAVLPDATGAPQPLSQWRGRPLVVNFWATWCAPCVEEMPDLQRIRGEYRSRGVEVIGIGIDSAARIRAFRDQHGIAFPLLVAGVEGSELGRQLGNTEGALPYTVLFDPEGRLVRRKLGQIRPAELRRWLDPWSATPG